MRVHAAAALLGVATVLAACGGATTPEVADVRSSEQLRARPATYDCYGVSGTAEELTEGPRLSEFEDHPGYETFADRARTDAEDWVIVDASDERLAGVRELEEPFTEEDGQRRTHERVEVSLVPAESLPESNEDTWMLTSAGPCSLQAVLKGLGSAYLRIDPESKPEPSDEAIDLLVTEAACASGESAEGRIEVVAVQTTEEQVRLVLGVRPREGGGECPGNPPTPFTVAFGEPLGDREIVDAAVLPPKVIWSPSGSAGEKPSPQETERQSPSEVVAEGCRTDERFGITAGIASDATGDPTPQEAVDNWIATSVPALSEARVEVESARATFFSASGEAIGDASLSQTQTGGWVVLSFTGCGHLSPPGEPTTEDQPQQPASGISGWCFDYDRWCAEYGDLEQPSDVDRLPREALDAIVINYGSCAYDGGCYGPISGDVVWAGDDLRVVARAHERLGSTQHAERFYTWADDVEAGHRPPPSPQPQP